MVFPKELKLFRCLTMNAARSNKFEGRSGTN